MKIENILKKGKSEMEQIRDFKHYESVECEVCGKMATEFDGGIVGHCEHCGYDWGDWSGYQTKIGISTDMELLDPDLEDVHSFEGDVHFLEIDEQTYQKRHHVLKSENKVVFCPEFVLSSKPIQDKPECIESRYYECKIKPNKYFLKEDFWVFPDSANNFKMKLTVMTGIDCLRSIKTDLPIIMESFREYGS